jgi:hypothetical protein
VAGPYDRQLICALLGGADNASISAQAEALNRKRRDPPLPSEVVAVQRGAPSALTHDVCDIEALRLALSGELQVKSPLTGRSRLYLLGEGSAVQRTLGGWDPAALAMLLARAGLREVGLISIVGDGAGRDPARSDAEQTHADAVSFASLLHRALRHDHGIVTTINARVGAVRVVSEASGGIEVGRKITGPQTHGGASQHHAANSKLRLWWDGDQQLRAWSY